MRTGSAGRSPTRMSAWSTTFLSVVMSLFLTTIIATALGTLTGNFVLLSIIGMMAKRAEEKQKRELERLQQGYLEMVQREKERIERYAKMEG